jgi:hypothetical protein
MGRKPIGKVAMTGAERVAKHRAKAQPQREWSWCFTLAELEAIMAHEESLKARISELEAELATERAKVGRRRR